MLKVRNLNVYFKTERGVFPAVKNFSMDLDQNQIVSIVGESGSGKSVSMLALMGLLGSNSIIEADEINFDGDDILNITQAQKNKYLGKKISMIFQDPTTSLNPCFKIGDQVAEIFLYHQKLSKKQAKIKALEVLTKVGIADPERRYDSYPHQLSGGMNQRVVIAIAIALNPKMIIADEPTTALDVTIQSQILSLLNDIKDKFNIGIVLITHDIGVVAMMADRVITLYRGEQLEIASKEQLINSPKHPYTQDLLASLPESVESGKSLTAIQGSIPALHEVFTGCIYSNRCKFTEERCYKPVLIKQITAGHMCRCIRY